MSKILVVDDEPDLERLIRQRFRRRIRSGDFGFAFAKDGEDALASLARDPAVDIVLADINMPVMDGLTLLSQLGEKHPNLRAVIVSAYGDMRNIRTAMNRGAFDFVTKPIDFADLEVTIDRTIEHLRLLRGAIEARDRLAALRQELEVAHQMQQSILPPRSHASGLCVLWANMTPAREVGGDFYDYLQVPDGRLGLAIADVSDKGVPAALFMAVSRALLRASASDGRSPGACLRAVNDLLAAENEQSMFVTLFYGLLDTATGDFVYASAGHGAPYVVGPGQCDCVPKVSGMALGVVAGQSYAEGRIRLRPGETLFLHTDGIGECFDAAGSQFGAGRLEHILRASADGGPKDLVEAVIASVGEFARGAPQSDDMTCLAVRFDGDAAQGGAAR